MTALITGASSGIGLEFSRLLAESGEDLVVVARSTDKLILLKNELEKKYPIKVTVLTKDLSELNSAEWIYDQIKLLKIEITTLINNAGIGNYGEFTQTELKKDEQMIMLNIITLTKLTKLFAQDMVKRKQGKILNVASTAAFQAGPLMAVYFATKAYVLSFSEALANELAGTGVTVTILCPGPTATGFLEVAQIKEQKMFQKNGMADSRAVAKFGLKAMNSNRTIAVHGIINLVGTLYAKFFPRQLVIKTFRFLIDLK